MKIIALDTSTTITGYAIYEDWNLIHYSSIDKSSIKNTSERMMSMVSSIISVIEQYSPDVVVIEETVVPRNVQAQRMLTMILGAVYGQCIQNGICYCSLRPTQWRSLSKRNDEKLPKKRDELKIWSINIVKDLFGIDSIDDNISDAILIGRAFWLSIQMK